ncbi:MAG: peptidase M16 [Eggerthellaceae bacterium]|nr:peptidase M16 [Eggerthellaceae bacterium]
MTAIDPAVLETASRHGFSAQSQEALPEIEGDAFLLRHDASGARLLYLRNDDVNKAFSVSFKTPAADDTGVFHILEHSVLCGSERFPVKEPFVNLLKSSMQTFLNAMTFPDKTMYPVASTNERDLLNLAHVYLDAVFRPAIYDKRTTFEQEGWHLETVGADGAPDYDEGARAGARPRLAYNGVVFNEMKGALSDPDSVLYDALSAALFPDTTYRFESGGTPDAIPTLTFEGFLDSHRRHYRPDNSYLTLYGDLDLDRFLGFIDEEYLTPLAERQRADGPLDANPLELQAPVVNLGVRQPMATAPENAACALGYVVGTAHDRDRVLAADILLDAIMGSNEAPLKRALLDAGLADDAQAFLADAVAQPFAVIQLKGLRSPDAPARLAEVVEAEARRLAGGGLDRELIEAALSHAEFVTRERNFGYPDGVLLSMSALSGWLYDEGDACAYLRFEDAFARLREQLGQGYFEQLLAELVLDNPHRASVELVCEEGDGGEALRQRLAELERDATDEDLAAIEASVRALREVQETPDPPELLACLPSLTVADVQDAPEEPAYGMTSQHTPVPCLRHALHTRGLVFAYRYFDLSRLSFEELPYATVLAMVLGKLPTARHTAAELDTLAQSKLGNLSFFTEVHEDAVERTSYTAKFVASASSLAENVGWTASLPDEILTETDFSDHAKILDILKQKRVSMEQGIANAGHSSAMARVASYYLPAAVVREQMGGMDFYRFLKGLIDRFDERADALEATLVEISGRLFADDGCILSFAGTDEDLDRYWEAGGSLGLSDAGVAARLIAAEPTPRREAFVVPSDVTYTAMGYDRRLFDGPFTGIWMLVSRALSYDYLWNEVRVKGGAYGAGFQMTRPGSMRFYSYRDPHIDETVARFEEAGSWVSGFDPSPAEMDGYVVSTIAGIDAPLKARELMRRQDAQFFSHFTPEQRARVRSEVIGAAPEQVRELGPAITRATSEHLVCTVGNRALIEESSEDFEVIDLLNG